MYMFDEQPANSICWILQFRAFDGLEFNLDHTSNRRLSQELAS